MKLQKFLLIFNGILRQMFVKFCELSQGKKFSWWQISFFLYWENSILRIVELYPKKSIWSLFFLKVVNLQIKWKRATNNISSMAKLIFLGIQFSGFEIKSWILQNFLFEHITIIPLELPSSGRNYCLVRQIKLFLLNPINVTSKFLSTAKL